MTGPMIGHNGPPFDIGDLPPDITKLHFFKCDIQALRKAIFDKPLDIRGAFISALLAMYEFMEPLPADDNIARMRCGIMDMRVYRRVKRELIALGLVYLTPSGRISNERFEEEIEAYVTEFRKRQEAAKERESKHRSASTTKGIKPELSPSYAVAKPELSPSYAVAKPELGHDLSEKPNDFNGGDITTTLLRARVLELELELERERRRISEGGVGEIAAPEGSALHSQKSLRTKVSRAAKMRPDWVLPKAWGEWALANYVVSPHAVRAEAAKFKDHWISTGGKKIDWEATWRNWCRSDIGKKWKPRDGINGSIVDGDLLSVAAEPVDDGWAEVREMNRLEREREQ